jgi:allophanate hydrolase subunit 2
VFRKTLRVVEGAQRDWFDPGAGRLLAEGEFLVAEASDRIGTRLDGPWPAPPADRSLWTEGALPGGVQVTPDGVGIVLGADAPTTGGYPKIAAVIAADLPALGQLRPRDRVRFAWVDRPAALREAVDLERRVHAAFGGTMRP